MEFQKFEMSLCDYCRSQIVITSKDINVRFPDMVSAQTIHHNFECVNDLLTESIFSSRFYNEFRKYPKSQLLFGLRFYLYSEYDDQLEKFKKEFILKSIDKGSTEHYLTLSRSASYLACYQEIQ